jgi:protein-disulfide isomerase
MRLQFSKTPLTYHLYKVSCYCLKMEIRMKKILLAVFISLLAGFAVADEISEFKNKIQTLTLSCPHCSQYHNNTFQQIKKDYIDTGKVLYVLRDLPLNKPAFDAARIAHCSRDKYFTLADSFFSNQDKWAYTPNYLLELEKIVVIFGISKEQVNSCLLDQKIADFISIRAMNSMKALRIDSTPTFFVNLQRVDGSKPYKYFQMVIEEELARAN